MEKKTFYDLGQQQQRILETVWNRGGATVREVWETISPNRRLAYTSVLSAMQKLERTGWLRHDQVDRSYVYRATRPREVATLEAARKFVDLVYDGDTFAMLRQLHRAARVEGGPPPTLRALVDLRRSVAPSPFRLAVLE